MRTEIEIMNKLYAISNDSRLAMKDAHVQINAPLALEQLGLKTRKETIEWVLGLKDGLYAGDAE